MATNDFETEPISKSVCGVTLRPDLTSANPYENCVRDLAIGKCESQARQSELAHVPGDELVEALVRRAEAIGLRRCGDQTWKLMYYD